MDYRRTYGDVRGCNYTPSTACNDIDFWRDYDEALVEQELTYAQRLGLNSARVFLSYAVYEHDAKAFLRRLRHFVRVAHDRSISTMPVIWDSCFSEIVPSYDMVLNDWIPNPGVQRLGRDFWPEGERFCQDIVQTLGPEPGLLIWDIMNEPLATSYVLSQAMEANPSERERRTQIIWTFVRHFCNVMRKLDEQHPITVGVNRIPQLAVVSSDVDVMSLHDYRPTRATYRADLEQGLDHADKLGKPFLLTEIACLARANPYDMCIEICHEYGVGWYIWELMIGVSRWRDIHGVLYPDGTVRDPSIVAALQGFFRKRSGEIIPPNLNKEGAITRVLAETQEWLQNPSASYEQGLAKLEVMANLLEAGEMVPMCRPPSVQTMSLSVETPDNREELCRLLERWGPILKSACT